MNRLTLTFLILLLPAITFAQYKNQAEQDISEAIIRPGSSIFLGIFNPERFQMHHTFSASYMTFGGNGLMLNSYMNTINYQISDPLFLRLNLGLMYSPYNSFNNNPALNSTKFFGGAELQYKPSDKLFFKVGVDVAPYYNYIYSPYPLQR